MTVFKVLVIDDHEAHAQGLAELLQLSEFTASYATSGIQGLELALNGSFDAILLDIHIPDLNGYEICRQLRLDPRTANLTIVFHSAAAPTGSHYEGDAFLTYPVEMSHISSVIRGGIARRKKLLP